MSAQWIGGYSGTKFLLVFPDARTAALAGCGAALTDLEANPYYNPACLVTGPRAAATWSHYPTSSSWISGTSYDYAGVAYRFGERLGFAASVSYVQSGSQLVIGVKSETVGIYRPLNVAPGVSAAYRVLPSLSAGAGVKAVYSFRYPEWAVKWDEFGLLHTGEGDAFTVAFDAGTQYRPWRSVTLGASIENLGPRLRYGSIDREKLPALVRAGFAFRPHVPGPCEVALVGDIWRDLASPMDWWLGGDTTVMVWENLEHGIGVEIRVAKTASLRLGYIEDIADQVGGIIVPGPYGYPRHISLLRFLLERHGKPTDLGLCWGAGLEYGPVRFDVGVDESVIDYATRSIRFQLSARL
jgi:hypothetical protein